MGTIVRNNGLFALQNTDASGVWLGGRAQPVYTVRFAARELWGSQASARDAVYVDLWEDDLERPGLFVTLLPSTATRLAYLAFFGAGSIAGMAILSGLLGWPLARLWHDRWIGRSLSLLVGCASTALGLSWAYPLLSRAF